MQNFSTRTFTFSISLVPKWSFHNGAAQRLLDNDHRFGRAVDHTLKLTTIVTTMVTWRRCQAWRSARIVPGRSRRRICCQWQLWRLLLMSTSRAVVELWRRQCRRWRHGADHLKRGGWWSDWRGRSARRGVQVDWDRNAQVGQQRRWLTAESRGQRGRMQITGRFLGFDCGQVVDTCQTGRA